MGTQNKSRFDDWEADCNECECYYDGSCSGVPVGEKRSCTAFKATRRADIPQQMTRIKRDVKILAITVGLLAVTILLLIIDKIF